MKQNKRNKWGDEPIVEQTDLTRVKMKESEDDLKQMLKKEEEMRKKDSKSPSKPGKGSSSAASPGGRRRSSVAAIKQAVKKKVARGKNGGAGMSVVDEDANSNLTPFINAHEEDIGSRPQHEPPTLSVHGDGGAVASPPKSCVRESRYSAVKSPSLSSGGGGSPDRDDDVLHSGDRLIHSDTQGSGVSGSGGGSSNNLTQAPPSPSGRRSTIEDRAVKKGVHFQRTFAVKTILTSRVNKDQLQELVNEIMIMRKLVRVYLVLSSFTELFQGVLLGWIA